MRDVFATEHSRELEKCGDSAGVVVSAWEWARFAERVVVRADDRELAIVGTE